MEKSSFFTSLNGDRRYKASDFAEYFKTFIGNGVFPNPSTNLQVISNGDMTITLAPGYAWINGYMYSNTDNLILTVDHADSALKRIDRVVIKCDFVNREIRAYIKKGIFATNPVAPQLERGSNSYELSVADILVDNGVISIAQSKITDTRLNTILCGIVTQTIKEIDTTELYAKLQAYIDERGQDIEGWIGEATSAWEIEFRTWFENIKDVLGEDVAGSLAERILNLEDKVNNMKLEDTAITVKDINNHFSGNKLNEVLDELFISADNIKKTVANSIGSPLLATDTSKVMGEKIDNLTRDFIDILISKNVQVSQDSKIQTLINKASEISIRPDIPIGSVGVCLLKDDDKNYLVSKIKRVIIDEIYKEVSRFTDTEDGWFNSFDISNNKNLYITRNKNRTIKKVDSNGVAEWENTTGETSNAYCISTNKVTSNEYVVGFGSNKIKKYTEKTLNWTNSSHVNIINSVLFHTDTNIYTACDDWSAKKINKSGSRVWSYDESSKTYFKGHIVTKEGYSLLCTDTRKVILLNSNGTLAKYTEKQGESVNAIAVDDYSNVYSGSENKIIKQKIDLADIIWQSNEYTCYGKSLKICNNSLYVNSNNSIYKLNLDGSLISKSISHSTTIRDFIIDENNEEISLLDSQNIIKLAKEEIYSNVAVLSNYN